MQYNILQHYNKRLNGGCSMGFFANAAGNTAQVEYASAKKKGYIACKDGRIHAFLYTCLGKVGKTSGFDEIFTTEIENILACLYSDGYEVVDIKFQFASDLQRASGVTDRYPIIVLYR
jgi:hypothetical protein